MSKMQRARLIPTSGINGQEESELRATSSLLAVIGIVRDFSVELLAPLGSSRAAKATVEALTEVEIKLDDGKVRPDGLLIVTYGKSEWRALVEVKTGKANLQADQLNRYLEAAKLVGADIVISISNEIGVAGAHPTEGLRVRANSKIKVHHYSWSEILAKAVKCKVHAGVDDPEQAWILGELIRYLEHPSSGVTDFADMGSSWVDVRDGARKATLTKRSEGVAEIAEKWDELLRHLALQLTAETGVEVSQVLPRAQRDPKARAQAVQAELVDAGLMAGTLRVPGAIDDVNVTADLRARQITVDATIAAPPDKKAKGSIGWLIRQLANGPADLLIEAYEKNARTPSARSLAEVRADSSVILPEGRGDFHKFRLVLHSEAGQNRKGGGRSLGFVDSVNHAVERFYEDILQHIDPWTPPSPKVKKQDLSGEVPQIIDEPNDQDKEQSIHLAEGSPETSTVQRASEGEELVWATTGTPSGAHLLRPWPTPSDS